MNKNIEAIKLACEIEGIPHKVHHATGNLITVKIGENRYLFVNWTTPLNPQSIMQLCQDKDYFYSFYKNVIKMPVTSSFLNPYSTEKYQKYRKRKTVFEIIEAIESGHNYPLIVKRNRGSLGNNVFKVCSRRELEKSIIDIFNMNSASFDYVCLAQEFINIESEFRVLFLNGEYQFSYKKVLDDAQYTGNLSPLHWEGARAELITEAQLIEDLKVFCSSLFSKLLIPFCGLDIAIDKSGQFWLIEANSAPGFDRFIEHGGKNEVVQLYRNMLSILAFNS